MNYQGVGILDLSNCIVNRTRIVTAADLDVDGLLTLDLEGSGPLAPILQLDDGLLVNGLKITDGGQDIMGTWLADGISVSFCNVGAGASLGNNKPSIAAAYRFSISTGVDIPLTPALQPARYYGPGSVWAVASLFSPDTYATSDITNDSGVSGAQASDALNTLNTGKANLASPTFTGAPLAPTATPGTNTTQLATTAFVTTADNLKANLASPTFTGAPLAPTATAGTNSTQLATTAYVDRFAPTRTTLTALVVAASPTYTTILTVPTAASTAYTIQIVVDVADDPVSLVRSGRWIFQAAFHRNNTGVAVIDGTPNVTTIGGFGSMAGTAIVSTNDILFQIRFSAGATVNATVESRLLSQTPG